jgi:hypothetical protein
VVPLFFLRIDHAHQEAVVEVEKILYLEEILEKSMLVPVVPLFFLRIDHAHQEAVVEVEKILYPEELAFSKSVVTERLSPTLE